MVAELAAWGPLKCWRGRSGWKNESGIAQNFCGTSFIFSSKHSLELGGRNTLMVTSKQCFTHTHTQTQSRHAVLGQCFNSGTGLRDLKAYLAPLPSRHWLGKHTIAALVCICTYKCLYVCVHMWHIHFSAGVARASVIRLVVGYCCSNYFILQLWVCVPAFVCVKKNE